MKKILKSPCLFAAIFMGLIFLSPDQVSAAAISERLKGQILLQVEGHGEAWYVSPQDQKRYFLGRPSDAFNIMVKMGLGAKHSYITGHAVFPSSVSGKILIDVEDRGKAYYIYPKNLRAYYLGRPADAFAVMKNLGLGITNQNLGQIKIGTFPELDISAPSAGSNTFDLNQDTQIIGMQIFDLTNEIRREKGLSEFKYSEALSKAGENHSEDMVDLNYFDHNREGKKFYDFVDELGVKYMSVAENIAYGYRTAEDVVDGWMNSQGHRANMLGNFMHFGVGIAKNSQGRLYYSEYFTR